MLFNRFLVWIAVVLPSLDRGHLKLCQGFAQPPLRLEQLVRVVHKTGEGMDDLLVIAEVVAT